MKPSHTIGVVTGSSTVSVLTACAIGLMCGSVLTSCRAPGQPATPAAPLLTPASLPYQGAIPPYFVRLGKTDQWTYTSGISDDGRSVCGEIDVGDTSGAHAHGVRWDLVADWPPSWKAKTLPFASGTTINNFAAGISPNGVAVAGDNSVTAQPNSPLDTSAYRTINGVTQAMPFLPQVAQSVAEGRAAANTNAVVGHIGIVPGRVDLDRFCPAIAVAWVPGGNGVVNVVPLSLPGEPLNQS